MKPRLRLIHAAHQDSALEVQGVDKVFRVNDSYLNVLEKITFKADTGEMICILGPSGCGKSTLLKIISGFMMPSAGQIFLNKEPVSEPGPDRCVVFQEDALFPWLTVAENIAFGLKGRLKNKNAVKKEVNRFLDVVGLSSFKDYLPREISGGMKQRVALARVLILNPQILLMDEPFAALDAQTRENMQNLLLTLWKKFSNTILFVTHDVVEAVTLADRILIMSKNPGQIIEEIMVSLKRPRKKSRNEFHNFCRQVHEALRF